MIEARGNLWDMEADARCVTTNSVIRKDGTLVMGAGIAKQAAIRHPDLPARIASLIRVFGNWPFYFPDLCVMTFPTKEDWRNPSIPELIKDSAQRATWLADAHKLKRILLPRPGCDRGGLDWEDVKLIIAPILDDRFVVCSPE